MTAPDRMLVWLREAMDAAERRADRWHDVECLVHATGLADAVVLQGATLCDCDGPAAVLRRITADRQLLDDLIAEQHNVVEDPAYTCPAATSERGGGRNYHPGACNCGQDERVQRRVRLLAEGYGWAKEEQR